MFFSNLTIITFLIFLLLILGGFTLIYKIYQNKNKNKIAMFLFLSFLFLIINIFEIKGPFINGYTNKNSANISFVLDVSKSMNAFDIKNKEKYISRLEGSKSFINYYLDYNKNNNYSLIIFGGEVMEVVPFTNNIGIFKTILYGVSNKNISKSGTNFSLVFSSLGKYFYSDKKGFIVIFTDGGDEDISILKDEIELLQTKGVDIIIVGIGTIPGSKIPNGKDVFGRVTYVTYMGEVVTSKLNRDYLQNLSKEYSFTYFELNKVSDFDKLGKLIKDNANYIGVSKENSNRVDLTMYFIFISFVFLSLFLFFELVLGRK